MVQIRQLHPEYVGSDGYAVRLRIPRKGAVQPVSRPPSRRRSRFERRLKDFPPPTPQDTPCVLWQGPLDHYGYGAMKEVLPNGARKSVKAHRWVMEQALGRFLSPAETILHLCDNPPCFRVSHLRVGTIQENNADMKAKGRAKPPPVNRLFGTLNPNTKVTPLQRIDVFEKWLTGTSMHALAAEYGVSSQRIHAICKMFRQDWLAWQGTFALLVAQGHDPRGMCEKLQIDFEGTRWQDFKPINLRSEASLLASERTPQEVRDDDEPVP